MDQFLKELGNVKDFTGVFSMWDVLIAMCLSFVLTLVVAKVYKETHRGVSYTQSFTHTLILMSVVVTLIMLIIGSNLARAFALVGALSIVRFRTAIKESRDIGFVFFAMAVGMACGTRFYLMAMFATALISAFIVVVSRLDLFSREIHERLLMVQIPEGFPYEREFEDLFRRSFSDYSLISIETVTTGELNELIYNVTIRDRFDGLKFLAEMRKLNGGHRVSLIEGQQQIDL